MKKRLFAALAVLVLCFCFCTSAFAADTSRSYEFDLTINGSHEVQAAPGDVLTAVLVLKRTDAEQVADMYAMQDEIRYDDEFFEIVEGSELTAKDIETADISLMGGDRAFYMNYLSFEGGSAWDPTVTVGSFQVKVLAENGSSELRNENCQVSVKDGSDSFAAAVNDVKVIVSTDCTVRFDPMDGASPWEVTVPMGSLLERPQDPEREAYEFTGWYRDTALTQPWDFKKDTVEGNMTLYAGWEAASVPSGTGEPEQGPEGGFPWWIFFLIIGLLILALLILLFLIYGKKTVRFDTDGGSELKSIRVHKGDRLEPPEAPFKEGTDFVGWYTDEEKMKRWDFEEDTVEESMTLYAKWR